jgi:SAM-dependent methyltransferase
MTASSRGSADLESAYEGLEDPNSFPDRASLERYREALFSRTVPQADFLAARLPGHARVLEIGCGNGRLLVELRRRGAVEQALGLDLAASRIEFARSWARDEGAAGLRFAVADALEQELPEGEFAAALCITGAFGYFDAWKAGAATALARRINRALEPWGLVFLEIYPHPAYRTLLAASGGRARIWTELPPEDPWRFYLSNLALDETGLILTHEKTFIHRTSGRVDSGRRERLYLYSEDALKQLLLATGFADVRAYEGWTEKPYEGGETMVVTAVKASPT